MLQLGRLLSKILNFSYNSALEKLLISVILPLCGGGPSKFCPPKFLLSGCPLKWGGTYLLFGTKKIGITK